jgi:large subunit ribosomal protein L22
MEIVSQQKYLRTSVRKMKGVAHAVVGMNAYNAIDRLTLKDSKASGFLMKAIKSAVSNAKNNNKLDDNSMVIKTVEVLKGPFFKRWQPVSKGMAHSIKKRTVHLKIVLETGNKNPKKIEAVKDTKETEITKINPSSQKALKPGGDAVSKE